MEFLQHTATDMAVQKFHSPYSISNKNNHNHYVPLFPFTHPAHNKNVRRLRAIVSPGSQLMFSIINRIGKEQKCADLQNGHRSAKICRETLHDQHLPYFILNSKLFYYNVYQSARHRNYFVYGSVTD